MNIHKSSVDEVTFRTRYRGLSNNEINVLKNRFYIETGHYPVDILVKSVMRTQSGNVQVLVEPIFYR